MMMTMKNIFVREDYKIETRATSREDTIVCGYDQYMMVGSIYYNIN